MLSREKRALAALKQIQEKVDRQSEDAAIWLLNASASEAYLQRQLRELHDVIERHTIPLFETSMILSEEEKA